MKKFLGLLILTLPLLAQDDDWSLNSHFTLTGDFLYFKRSLAHKINFIYNDAHTHTDSCNRCKFDDVCTSGHLVKQFDLEPGYRVGASFITRRSMIEANFMHLEPWEGECGQHNNGELYFSLKHAGFFHDYTEADHGHIKYSSRFEAAEFNYWRFISYKKDDYFSSSWVLGLHYFHIPEELHLAFERGGNKSTGEITVSNQIGGLQGGFSIQWNAMSTLSLDLITKIGGAFAWAEQTNHIRDYNNTVSLIDFHANNHSFPFFIDFWSSITWQMVDWFNVHVGYQWIYINGFAAATDQLVKHGNPQHTVHMTGAANIYGLYAGATLSF